MNMNINARLDHLLDRFKHDVRDLIDSAVAEEREQLVKRMEAFIKTGGKPNADPAIVDKIEGYAKGGYIEGGPTIVIGEKPPAMVTIDKTLIDDLPPLTHAKALPTQPIKVEFARKCEMCGDSIEGTHKRRKICIKPECRKAYMKRQAAAHTKRQKEKIEARKSDDSNPPKEMPDNTPPLSNRPLSEFLGTKKKRPFLCGFCGKPCDDRYCSTHCEDEDKRLSSLNKGKSYSEYLSEKGIKKPVEIEP